MDRLRIHAMNSGDDGKEKEKTWLTIMIIL